MSTSKRGGVKHWASGAVFMLLLLLSPAAALTRTASQRISERRGASASAGSASASAGAAGASASAGASTAASSTSTYLHLKPTAKASSSAGSSAAASASSTVPTAPSTPSTPELPDLIDDVFSTIKDFLESKPELSIFLKLIEEVLGKKIDLAKTVLTLLAPTDAAFEALASTLGKTIEELLDIPILKKIILYHILPEIKTIAEFAIGEFIETLLEGELGIKVDVVQALTEILPTGGPPADVILKDIKAGEAILHVIGGVLIPTSEVEALESLLSLAEGVVSDAAPSAAGK